MNIEYLGRFYHLRGYRNHIPSQHTQFLSHFSLESPLRSFDLGCLRFSRNRSAVDFLPVQDTFVTVITKIVQLVMACAIFNPFCCCTAELLVVDDSEPAVAVHSCCSQSSELPVDADQQQEHDISECPHRALKDYEATIHKDVAAMHDTVLTLPVLLALIDYSVFEPVELVAVEQSTLSQAPPPSFAQVYCVYRI